LKLHKRPHQEEKSLRKLDYPQPEPALTSIMATVKQAHELSLGEEVT